MLLFDIGANIGRWSLVNVNDTNKIIAIEASPNTYNQLCNNCKSINNILCLNYAVCNSDQEYIDFYDCSADTLSTINRDWLDSESSRFYNQFKYNTIKCKTISIDKLIEIYGLPDLIKIDVEGGEYECLSSLTKKVNNLCFEWASETKDITLKCLDHLKNIGYVNFSLQFEDNYIYRPETYSDINTIKQFLDTTTPKNEWGMIWVKL